jgi:hypothetical protein
LQRRDGILEQQEGRIELAPKKGHLALLAVASSALTILAVFVATKLGPFAGAGTKQQLAGYIGALLFGCLTASGLFSLLRLSRPSLVLTDSGIHLVHMFERELPWGSVLGLRIVERPLGPTIALEIAPETVDILGSKVTNREYLNSQSKLMPNEIGIHGFSTELGHLRVLGIIEHRIAEAQRRD